MPPATRAEFEVAIICALSLEASAVVDLFDEHYDDDGDIYGKQERDSNTYSTGRIGQHDIVLAHMPAMGKSSAASVASGLRLSFTGVKLALIVGICGAVPIPSSDKPIILGDVVISNSVVEFDFGRQYPDRFEKKSSTKDTLGRPNTDIRGILSKLEVRRFREKLGDKILQNLANLLEKNDTARYPGVHQDKLFAATHRHMHRRETSSQDCICFSARSHGDPVCESVSESDCDTLACNRLALLENTTRRQRLATEIPIPLVHIGTIGSASTVMKSGEHRDLIAQEDKIIAFEMEGAGVWDNLPCVIIKGVCDYADSHKNKRWQGYAAATAASAAKAFLDYWTPRQDSKFSGRTPSRKRAYSPNSEDGMSVSRKTYNGPSLEGQNPMSVPTRTDQASTSLQSVPAPTDLGTRQINLEALNFEQLDARHATIKKTHTGTCKWLFSKSEYLDWQDEQKLPEHHGFLWIKGKPGAGKSAIMKFAHAGAQAKSKNSAVISYFFNARGERLEKSTCGMYRSLLFQLLNEIPRLQTVLDSGDARSLKTTNAEGWSTEILQALFFQAVEKLGDTPLTCFVDALDECEDNGAQVRQMVDFFEELGECAVENKIRFLVCFSSRHYPHITIKRYIGLTLETQLGHSEDITKYIQSKLNVEPGKFVNQIKVEVQEKSQGIFLWVVLVVPILQEAYDNGDVHTLRDCLKDIPDDLNTLFKDILSRDTKNMRALMLCLRWILYARRPLRPEELYFAIRSGVEPDSVAAWDPDSITAADINRYLLSSSKGLAEPTKTKSPIVQFIHESVRDFLLRENGLALLQETFDSTSMGPIHDLLKQCCQHYIVSAAAGQSEGGPSKVTARFPFLDYSLRHIFKHAELAASHMVLQEGFLANFALDSWIALYNMVEKFEVRRYNLQTSLLYILVEQNNLHLCRIEVRKSQSINTRGGRYDFPIIAAAVVGNTQILELLLEHGANMNLKGKEYENALHAAVDRCNTSAVQFLISRDAVVESPPSARWETLLNSAVKKQNIFIVKYLLTSQSGITFKLFDGANTPLHRVIRDGDTKMLKLILSLSCDPLRYDCALGSAFDSGKEATTHMLLQWGADADAHVDGGNTSQIACITGSETVVRVLVEKGADVNADTRHGPALVGASSNGHDAIVRMLLDHGADINAANKETDVTALFAASTNGHERVVRILLDHGTGVNGPRISYGFALQAATSGGCETIVCMLLDHGADVNKVGMWGVTALHTASFANNVATVRMLLDRGADVNGPQGSTQKPLHYALKMGQVDVACALLDYGADIYTPSNDFPNAMAAVEACSFEPGRTLCRQILLEEERKRQSEQYLVWVDGVAYLNYR